MKKFLLIMLLPILLIGCQSQDFAFKEKCSQFVKTAKLRYEESAFKGTFYSKAKDTCVSVYLGEFTDYSFYDELIGQFLYSGISGSKLIEIENSLKLMGNIK